MALRCQMSLNYASYAAGQNPSPQATLFVYNPNASAVVVTGARIYAFASDDNSQREIPMAPVVPPLGPGMTVVAPTLSSINIGPFAIVVASAANVNSFQAVNQTGNLNPINPQGSQPPQMLLGIGAIVYGSDGSVNRAGSAPLLVSYSSAPPLGYQGGFLNWAAPNNFLTFAFLGAL